MDKHDMPSPAQRQGFTLIEVVIAVLVLAVGLGAALSLVLNGLQWARDVRRNTIALQTARSVLEEPRLIDPDYDPTVYSVELAGFVNGLYVVREGTPITLETYDMAASSWNTKTFSAAELDALGGHYEDVSIKIYEGVIGGDVSTGELILEQDATLYRQLH